MKVLIQIGKLIITVGGERCEQEYSKTPIGFRLPHLEREDIHDAHGPQE